MYQTIVSCMFLQNASFRSEYKAVHELCRLQTSTKLDGILGGYSD